ncbi:MAG: hypothetical protein IH608_09840 [Proteobacteria bacterium]|nr:hypothetical protein [Pseudomonadota bacterium]
MKRSAMLLLLAAGVAAAQEQTPGRPQAPAQVEMDAVEIRGELERPEVFYIIPRREVRMDLGPLSKDYREEILQPLLPGPFEERAARTRP